MSSTSDPGRSNTETSPIVDQFENREDGSSRECPDADDPSAEIGVSDDYIEFMRDVTADIFGRHGPNNYLPSNFHMKSAHTKNSLAIRKIIAKIDRFFFACAPRAPEDTRKSGICR